MCRPGFYGNGIVDAIVRQRLAVLKGHEQKMQGDRATEKVFSLGVVSEIIVSVRNIHVYIYVEENH